MGFFGLTTCILHSLYGTSKKCANKEPLKGWDLGLLRD